MIICSGLFNKNDVIKKPPIKRIMKPPFINIEGDIFCNKHITITTGLEGNKDLKWSSDVTRWIEEAIIEKYEREYGK